MGEEELKKALGCSKEQLIIWLQEMYTEEKLLKEIIRNYENNYDVQIEYNQITTTNPIDLTKSLMIYTKINAKGFEYFRKWN